MAGPKRRNLHAAITGFFLLLVVFFLATEGGAFLVLANLWGAALHGLCAGVMPRFGIVVTTSGVTVRGFSTRQYPWSDVQSVEAVNFLGARRTQVRLNNGSKIRTWAPYDDFILTDMKFDHKLEALQHWHAEHASGPMVRATLTTAELPIVAPEAPQQP